MSGTANNGSAGSRLNESPSVTRDDIRVSPLRKNSSSPDGDHLGVPARADDTARGRPIPGKATTRNPERPAGRDRQAAQDFIDQLEALHRDPSRKDIAWWLGIDRDVIDPKIRRAEVGNWIDRLVRPNMHA